MPQSERVTTLAIALVALEYKLEDFLATSSQEPKDDVNISIDDLVSTLAEANRALLKALGCIRYDRKKNRKKISSKSTQKRNI